MVIANRFGRLAANTEREAKVRHVCQSIVIEDNIVRLDIAMHPPVTMHEVHGRGNSYQYIHYTLQPEDWIQLTGIHAGHNGPFLTTPTIQERQNKTKRTRHIACYLGETWVLRETDHDPSLFEHPLPVIYRWAGLKEAKR